MSKNFSARLSSSSEILGESSILIDLERINACARNLSGSTPCRADGK